MSNPLMRLGRGDSYLLFDASLKQGFCDDDKKKKKIYDEENKHGYCAFLPPQRREGRRF